MSLGPPIVSVLKRDLRRAFAHGAQVAMPFVFFLIVINLFPLAVGPQSDKLAHIGPAIVWVAYTLAVTLTLASMYRDDFHEGGIDALLLSAHPLALLTATKAGAHWLVTALPLVMLCLPAGVLFNLPLRTMLVIAASVLLGSPALSFIGGIASALTVGVRGGALLLALITLPLYIPVLIFGAAAGRNANLGLPVTGELLFLAGLSVLAVTLAPSAAAAALRVRSG